MMHTLYGFRGTGSAAVEIALVRAGVDYRVTDAASWDPASALAELGRANGLRQIPTLVRPDGSVLTESAAILLQLGLEFPASALLPTDARRRAQAIRGLVYIAANCYGAVSVCDFPERWCADADGDEAVKERIRAGARSRLHHHWDVFADTFPADPFLSGTALGALDILAAVVSRWLAARPHLLSSRPAFIETLERIEADATVAAVFAQHWPG